MRIDGRVNNPSRRRGLFTRPSILIFPTHCIVNYYIVPLFTLDK